MMYLYSRKNPIGLDNLVEALDAKRLYRFDGEDFWDKNRKGRLTLPVGSVIIPWGETLPELEGMRVLNGVERDLNKCEQWDLLNANGVKVIRAYPESQNPLHVWKGSQKYIPRHFGKKLELN